jgi:hypothetical protein
MLLVRERRISMSIRRFYENTSTKVQNQVKSHEMDVASFQ